MPKQPDALGEPSDSIFRNAAFTLAVKLCGAAFTAILTLYLVRALGPEQFGVFSLAVGVGATVVLLADFGISASAARFIAEHRSDPEALIRVLNDAIKLKLIASTVIAGGLFALAVPISNAFDVPSMVWPLRAVSVVVFAQSLMTLILSTFEALWRVSMSLRVVFTESAVETGASITLVLLGAGAAGAAWGRAAGYVAAVVVGAPLLFRFMGRPTGTRLSRDGAWRRLAGYASALFVIEGAMTIFARIDTLVIGAYLGPTSVGLFDAPVRLATLLSNGGLAVAGGVAPRMARTAEHEPNVAALATASRYLILAQGLLIAPLLVWATPLTDLLLGAGYEKSAGVLQALTPYVFLSGLAPLVALSVNYLGEAKQRVRVAIAAVSVNVVLDLILIPRIGIVGGAIGSDAAFAIYVPAHYWICRSMTGIELKPLVASTARACLAAAAMAGVLFAIGTAHLSAVQWVAGSLAGGLAYLVVLLVSRELGLAELRGAVRDVARRVRSLR